jgi:ABC-type multidrug transport system ATPase subunit
VAERSDRLLASAGLEQLKGQQAGNLSRGQRQRLAIARAVLHDPMILLLDEPFTGLDAAGCRWLREFLHQLRSHGCAMVIACHDVEECAFDRVLILGGRR